MQFSRPFNSYGSWDGYTVYAGVRGAHSVLWQRWVRAVPGRFGGRGANRFVLRRYRRSEGEPRGRGRGQLRRRRAPPRRRIGTRRSRASRWRAPIATMTTFYTALYRLAVAPQHLQRCRRALHRIRSRYPHRGQSGIPSTPTISDWDTYRGTAALHGLLFPEQASDMAQSLVNDAEQSGSFPRWALANSATAEMSGDSVVPLIVNLYAFGAKDFDVKAALRYMVNAATLGGVGRDGYLERPGIATYQHRATCRRRWSSAAMVRPPSASITLEWSVDDFAISRFAEVAGRFPRPRQNSRTGHSIGRTSSIPAPGTSRPAMPSATSPTAPGWSDPLRGSSVRSATTRATPSNTSGGCRRMSPAW